jgi:hypothetical protein
MDETSLSHLSPEAREWVLKLVDEYNFESHHLKVLLQAAECYDRITQARKQIENDGAYYVDRFGSPKSHPAVADERNGRVVFARLVRELNLDAGTPDNRPPRLKY